MGDKIYQNYWDFQERWNEMRPDYAHNMIAYSSAIVIDRPSDIGAAVAARLR
jgi:hypothetical protein